ncbi:hypothetical protein NA57DRAFT_53939 [Rhizodiscina lignyota]|uniref:Transcription factor domain-containing protein n=1 Tax=Rhizodiscina lignyota TaxID=1504668 RepID=A0A9P4IP76_9PEZI|nr:hypothetical protein NA57DRAFT_53939 [Rhizodiscina lignyota]
MLSRIAQDIANELHIVRASQDASEESSPSVEARTQPQNGVDTSSVFLLSTDVEGFPEFSLGTVSIPSQVIVELFQHFGRYYHVHAPFVQPIRSVSRFAGNCPLLFWTIILVACQNHAQHSNLYEQLFFPHKDLLAPLSNTAIRSMEEVHAILLLCLWPIPKRLPSFDPSWSYIGIAVNACMRLTFHNASPEDINTRGWARWNSLCANVDVQTQRMTWVMGCFSIVTVRAATWLGLPPPLSSTAQLKKVRKATECLDCLLSPQNRASLAINEIVCHYSVSLEDVEDPAAHFTLTQTFDSNLDTIKDTHSAYWTPELDIQLHYTKLNLYALNFLLPLQEMPLVDDQNVINRQILIFKGLDAASSLITQMRSISLTQVAEEQRSLGGLTYYPKPFFTSLFFAAVFLFRMVVSNPRSSQAHKLLGIQGLVKTHDIFGRMASHRDGARAANLIQRLVDKARSAESSVDPSSTLRLSITNCHGASLLWDTLFRIVPKTNGDPHDDGNNQAQGFSTQPAATTGLRRLNLPPAPEMRSHLLDTQTAFFNTPVVQDQGGSPWAFWDAYMSDFGLDFGQESFW